MELASSVDEVLVCLTCGDKGFPNHFIYCVKCLEFAIHRYCLDVIPETSDEFVIWFCEDCKPAGPYRVTLPKDEPLLAQKENSTNSAPVKTTLPKKKRRKKRINKKRKIVPLVAREEKVSYPEEVTESNCERVSPTEVSLRKSTWMSDPRRYVVLGLAKPESAQLDNCPPLKRVSSDEPLQAQKENSTNSAPVKTTLPKKKRHKKRINKKRKIVPLVAREEKVIYPEEVTESNCEHVSPTEVSLRKAPWMSDPRRYVVLGLAKPESAQLDNCPPLKISAVPKPVKTTPRKKKPKKKPKKKNRSIPLLNEASVKIISEPKQMSPCVEEGVLMQSSESAEVDICSPLEISATRKRDVMSLAETTNKNKIQKTSDPIQHSSCDSSCSNVNLKDTEDMTHSVEYQGFELKHLEAGHEKLVSDSSFSKEVLKKRTEDKKSQDGTLNDMQNKQKVSVDRDGIAASKSEDIENNLEYIPYQPARPVMQPVWRGSFDITQSDYELFEGFVGHLSNKACYMVCAEATTLPSMLSLHMQPKTDLWPKSFLESHPSDESIALYFFPGNPKNERDFEQLVNDMIDEDLAMRATTKNAELLIFTSTVLPQSFWRFQGNYYLWGVFRRKRNDCALPMNAAINTSDFCGQSEISQNEITDGIDSSQR